MVEGQKQHYLQFYFNSKYDGVGSKVERPSLNLVIALDVSGSMGETFKGETSKMKIQVAQESLLTLLKYSSSPLSLSFFSSFDCFFRSVGLFY